MGIIPKAVFDGTLGFDSRVEPGIIVLPNISRQYQSQNPPAAAHEQNVLVKKNWGLVPFSRTPPLHPVLLGTGTLPMLPSSVLQGTTCNLDVPWNHDASFGFIIYPKKIGW